MKKIENPIEAGALEKQEKKTESVQKNEEKQNNAESTSPEKLIEQIIEGGLEFFSEMKKMELEESKIQAIEETKRHEVTTKSNLKMFYGICFLGSLVIGLAFTAIIKGNPELSEKIVIGFFTGLAGIFGGIGISKSQSNDKKTEDNEA